MKLKICGRLKRKERAQADTDEQLAKIAKGEKRDKLLNDVKAHRANAELAKRVREEKEKEAEDIWGFHRARFTCRQTD